MGENGGPVIPRRLRPTPSWWGTGGAIWRFPASAEPSRGWRSPGLESSVREENQTSAGASGSAGILLFGAAIIFLAAVAACIVKAPFLLEDNNLSEFGVYPTTAFLFNGGLVVVGAMTVLAAWSWTGRHAWLFAAFCIMAGGCMIGAGLINTRVDRLVHAYLSGFDYAGNVLLTLALAFFSRGLLRATGFIAVALSLSLLLAWVFQAPLLFDAVQQGGTQFLTTLPLVAWMLAYTTRFLVPGTAPRTAPARGARGAPGWALLLPAWLRGRASSRQWLTFGGAGGSPRRRTR